jgi:hypothetical protein
MEQLGQMLATLRKHFLTYRDTSVAASQKQFALAKNIGLFYKMSKSRQKSIDQVPTPPDTHPTDTTKPGEFLSSSVQLHFTAAAECSKKRPDAFWFGVGLMFPAIFSQR